MKQHPEQLLAAARLAVVQMTSAFTDVEAPSEIPLTVAAYFAMCAELAMAELPEDFLSSADDVARRLAVHEAREYAADHIKRRALQAATPEYEPHG